MKFYKFVLVILTFFTLVSCTSNSLEKTYEARPYSKTSRSDFDLSSADASSTEEASAVSFPAVNNAFPINQLGSKTVDINEIVEKYFIEINTADDFYDIKADIGIECLRQNESGTYYSVNKVEQGGLLYIFYVNNLKEENYRPIIEWFYVQKSLSYSDFDSVNEGDSIEDVKNIDPATQIFINIYNADPNFWNDIVRSFGSHHYLKDGVLYIVYEYKDGKLSIKNKSFKSDFTIDYNTGTSHYYDGRILPIDRLD